MTLEEYIIDKVHELEEENSQLRNNKLVLEADYLKLTLEHEELLKHLTQDMEFRESAGGGQMLTLADNYIYEEFDKEKYDYYEKLLRNKKEEQ